MDSGALREKTTINRIFALGSDLYPDKGAIVEFLSALDFFCASRQHRPHQKTLYEVSVHPGVRRRRHDLSTTTNIIITISSVGQHPKKCIVSSVPYVLQLMVVGRLFSPFYVRRPTCHVPFQRR